MSVLLVARGIRVLGPDGTALVDGVDLRLRRGETLALVGASGAGKSLTARALIGLVPPPARMTEGVVELDGRDTAALGGRDPLGVRGRRIALVPQDPAASLNPVRRVGAQIAEVLRAHRGMDRGQAREAARAALAEVGVPRDDHPHRLSGGQRQRAAIALALAPGPEVVIADEPTSALDAPLRLEILALLRARRAAGGLALLLVAHDIGTVARVADRVMVMSAGRIVEEGSARAVIGAPRDRRTRELIASAPRLPRGGGA